MPDPALIIYDGDCIFCQNYVRLVRLRETLARSISSTHARTIPASGNISAPATT